MLPAIIAKLGLPLFVSLLAGALTKINNPAAQSAAKALNNFEGALAGGVISPEQMAEANRHAETLAEMKAREYESAMSEINQSLRAEISSSDVFVRRMRPTFGYLMAVTWAAQMFGIAYVVIFETEKAPAVLNSMEALSAIWAIGLSVLGIYVYKRSEEKKVIQSSSARQTPISSDLADTPQTKSNLAVSVKIPPKLND
jgi:hypothetical protein